MEEMSELFYKNTYAREFEAQVISCIKGKKGYEVILSDTAFYPEGGGQPADHGTLNEARVLDTKRRNGEVVHITDAPLEEGSTVKGVIDWERRFDHMQNHSGEHIVSGLVHNHFGYENVGFHMGDVITIDFDGPLTWEQAMMIEEEANELIWHNTPIQVLYPDEEQLKTMEYRSKKELTGKVRIILVENGDTCACCGTHVAYTGEIGLVRLLSLQKHKSGVRIEMVSGKRALLHDRMVSEQNNEISRLLSAQPDKTAEAVRRLAEESGRKDGKISALTQKYITMKLAQMDDLYDPCILFEEGLERRDMIRFADAVVREKGVRTCALYSEEAENQFNYVIISESIDLRTPCKTINAELSGRGGGKSDMVQGSVHADRDDILYVTKECLK